MNSNPAASPARYMQAMSTLRNISLLLLVSICFYFLFYKIKSTKEHSIVDDLETSGDFMNQPDSTRDKIALNNLVYSISVLQNLESDYIGIEGKKSTQFDYFETLKKWASTDQLINLTDHGNALVRTMAFQALADKKYIELKKIFKKHLNDRHTYNVHSGCVVEPVPVNIAFYRSIYPSLSSAEASLFKKELLKQYSDTYFEFNLRYL
jgi:Ca2+/Na+ antiporter